MEQTQDLTVSAIQITSCDGKKAEIVDKVARLLDVAGQRGSDLVVLPELWTGLGFSDETIYRDIAEP
ncbi:MAG: hypothetical protein LPL00_08885, partial [Alphaproteobacteria bacterium]|nr:hypothetical protein [Alphaproteobacteria bacterium]MDX5369737.1 hypothetical protein [Alphaproteobacteria bacterium]MDX5464361.1 hypothetical protein [Alphaproteobacteria bacterium]